MGGCAAARVTRVVPPIRFDLHPESLPTIDARKNLESYYLFWLDRTARSPEHIETQDDLRSIVNYVQIFDSVDECENEISKINKGTIFLLTDTKLGLEILAKSHEHIPLKSVYLYDSTNKTDSTESPPYSKIVGIYESLAMAKRYLEDDVKLQTDFDDPIVIDVHSEQNRSQDQIDYREKFHLFIQTVHVNASDVYDTRTRQRLIDICLDYYDGNEKETKVIEDFKNNYKSDESLTWYMRGSCFHRLLSRAFLEHDFSILVDMYSLIVDIDRCIGKQSSTTDNQKINLFRGQFLSPDLFNLLKNSTGQLLTMECFLMAQTSREETEALLNNMPIRDKKFKRILFEIEAMKDYTVIKSPSASTSQMVLFRLGSTFRIVDVTDTSIKLSQSSSINHWQNDLCSESPIVVRGLLTYLKHGTLSGIAYFRQILPTIPQNDYTLRAACLGQMAYLQQKKGDHQVAKSFYKESLSIGAKQFQQYLFYLDQAAEYHGDVLHDWSTAKGLWKQKLSIQENFASEQDKCRTYESLARASMALKEYDQVMEYTSAAMKGLTNDDPHRSLLQEQYDQAKKSSTH